MKSNLNKIILYFVTIFFLSSCHTLEHQNIFLKTVKKNQKQEIFNTEEKDTQNKSKKIENKKSSNKDKMALVCLNCAALKSRHKLPKPYNSSF